jgi:hypothetical protein
MMIIRAKDLNYKVSILDGDGRRIELPVCEVDTETGEIEYYTRDGSGRYCFYDGEIESDRVKLKLPIRFIGADGVDMTSLVVASFGE